MIEDRAYIATIVFILTILIIYIYKNKKNYSLYFEEANSPLIVCDRKLKILKVNKKVRNNHLIRDKFIGKYISEFFVNDTRESFISKVKTMKKDEIISGSVVVGIRELPVRIEYRAYRLSFNKILVQFTEDFNQKRENHRLKNIDEKFKMIIDAVNDVIFDFDVENNMVNVLNDLRNLFEGSDNATHIKFEKEEMQRYIDERDIDRLFESYYSYLENPKGIFREEVRIASEDRTIWVLIRGKLVNLHGEDEVLKFLGTVSNITSRKNAEEKLIRTNKKLSKSYEINKMGSWVYYPKNRFFKKDKDLARLFDGRFQERIKSYDDFIENVYEEDKEKLNKHFLEDSRIGEEFCGEYRFLKDEKKYYINIRGKRVYDDTTKEELIVGTAMDVTEQRRMQEYLAQNDKMKIIGTLTSGFVHDFNNNLMNISAQNELIIKRNSDSALEKDLLELKQIIRESSDTINKLLLFSRKGEMLREKVRVNELLAEVSDFIKPSLPYYIVVDLKLNANHDLIMGDYNLLKNSFVNIVLNSIQAIGKDNGKISIISQNTRYREKDKACIEVIIQDNGSGIKTKDLPHIMEPFYTTKGLKDGVGMGLYNVKNIVKRHQGEIAVESKYGQGALFKIILPNK